MKMCDCPKYERCAAPLCPLDEEWARRVYRKGEPICFYLLEYVKPNARAKFQGCIASKLYPLIAEWAELAFARYAPLRRALERAKRTGSRMGNPGITISPDVLPRLTYEKSKGPLDQSAITQHNHKIEAVRDLRHHRIGPSNSCRQVLSGDNV